MTATINEQQLAQWLPILQQLPAFNQPINVEQEAPPVEKKSSYKFSSTDLLTKKKRNMKSSEAQSSMSVSLIL